MGHDNPIGRIGRGDRPIEAPRMDFPRDNGQGNGPGMGLPVDQANPSVPTNTGIAPPPQTPEHVVDLPQLNDGFTADQLPTQSPILRGDGAPITKNVSDLVPDLQRMNDLGEIPARFASDMVLQKQQLASPGLPQDQVTQRQFEFFVKYASRFVEIAQPPVKKDGHLDHGDEGDGAADKVIKKGKGEGLPGDGLPDDEPGTPSHKRPTSTGDVPVFNNEYGEKDFEEASYPGIGKGNMFQVIEQDESAKRALREFTPHEREEAIKEFANVLRDAGFHELKDQRSGKDGVTVAQELLRAKSPEEVDKRAQFIELQREVAPEAKVSKGTITLELPLEPIRELGQSAQASPSVDSRKAVEAAYGSAKMSSPVAVDGVPPQSITLEMRASDETRPERRGNSSKVLGSRMLWNVLHGFRQTGEDSAEEQAKWERFTTGAILLLVLVMIGAIVLVNL